jgi:hypothetical protein
MLSASPLDGLGLSHILIKTFETILRQRLKTIWIAA